jgi:AcrR family transcriptional regulator
MVKQERAVRTRGALVRAAASEFYLAGYEGTSLKRISKTAGISMGAVTFHFATKADIAEAVAAEGCSTVRRALDAVTAREASAMVRLVDVTVELARLLQDDVMTRSAAHLVREWPHRDDWPSVWQPVVERLAEEAYGKGELRASVRPEAVARLVGHLVWGVEASLRHQGPGGAVSDLGSIWPIILGGLTGPRSEALEGRFSG